MIGLRVSFIYTFIYTCSYVERRQIEKHLLKECLLERPRYSDMDVFYSVSSFSSLYLVATYDMTYTHIYTFFLNKVMHDLSIQKAIIKHPQ